MRKLKNSIWLDPATTIAYTSQLNDDYLQFFPRLAIDELLSQILKLEKDRDKWKAKAARWCMIAAIKQKQVTVLKSGAAEEPVVDIKASALCKRRAEQSLQRRQRSDLIDKINRQDEQLDKLGRNLRLSELVFDAPPEIPKADMCGCSECGWKGKCFDCETAEESDGWESPTYQIHICPVCEDGGCVDDYWYSDELFVALPIEEVNESTLDYNIKDETWKKNYGV